jgi:thiol-disulfide isomerase/thioredoxin
MNFIYKAFLMIKPFLFVFVIVGVLQVTGQLGTVIGFGQRTVLSTGVLNAGDKLEPGEAFDFNFEAVTPDGKLFDKKALKGKVVFLNLWATWCGPCRAEMPTIEQVYLETKNKDVVFVILSLDQGPTAEKKVHDYMAKSQYTFPVYILKGTPMGQLAAVRTIPTTYVISKKGMIARTEIGMTNYNTDRFKNFLLKLASE